MQQSILNQNIDMVEASQCIVKLAQLHYSLNHSEVTQETIHTVLSQMCAAYQVSTVDMASRMSYKAEQPLSGNFSRSLGQLIDQCLVQPTFSEVDMVVWLRSTHHLREDLSLFKLHDLGLFGLVIGLFYQQLFQTKTYSGEWIFDLHNNCLVVPPAIRKHLLTELSADWTLYGLDLMNKRPLSNLQNTMFTIGVAATI